MADKKPITEAFGDFLVRIGLEGTFADIATVLYVTEGTYMDWAGRLINAGKGPQVEAYQAWIDIHGPDVLGEVVQYLGQYLDERVTLDQHGNVDRLFQKTLKYEVMFFDSAYCSKEWPND